MAEIDAELADFDPTVNTNTEVQQYNQTYQYSDSSDSEEEFTIKSNEKQRKVYHMNTYTKLDSKLSLHMINNEVEACHNKELTREKRYKDKSQRATVELVLDPRTRLILLKLISNGTLSQVNGCLSTGKQANVYHAKNESTNKEYAVKIYKTSILVFKDRQRYVEGEYRFRQGTSKNPRKMVKMWAQKEFRNLKRINDKIPSPVPLLVKTNVLVMDFIGKDVKIAPKLKQADIPIDQMSQVYLQLLTDMRILYQECKLVHADLSEYNLLYFQKVLYMIDVSQAVEHDHPHALDFLRRDIKNINDFFKKKGVHIFKLKPIFQFIALNQFQAGTQKAQLEKMIEQHDQNQEDPDDQVFSKMHIPRKLEQLSIQHIEKQLKQKQEQKIHHKLVGLNINQIKQQKQEQDSDNSDSDQQQQEQKEVKQGEDGERQLKVRKGGQTKYDGMSKLERKHKVKQQKRQKRKDKVPKHIKKQKTKK